MTASHPALLALVLFSFVTVGCDGNRQTRDNASAAPAVMAPGELQALPSNPADLREAYGNDSSQYGELRLPSGSGPHPVVVLVHGGCFKAAYATLRDLAPMGDVLKEAGIATWNIEYRRTGQPGGGWPGAGVDVSDVASLMVREAPLEQRAGVCRVLAPLAVVALGRVAQ